MMWLKTLYLVMSLWKVVMPTVLNCECGVQSGTSAFAMRIVGGRRAEPHSQPWAVVIMKRSAVHCGGAIITTKHVLSAGHCFKWDNFNDMLVYIGMDSLDNLKDVEKRKIGSVDIHEGFKSTAVRDEDDIAIAKLAHPVVFGETIWPICLPEPGENFGNRIGTIVGWGRVAVDEAASRALLKASLRILTDQECMASGLAEHLTNNMMCAFTKGIDGCQGDSGGPMLVFQNSGSYVQAGIVSWGFGCADPRFPGIYTKVADYIPWINEHSQDGDTCSKTNNR